MSYPLCLTCKSELSPYYPYYKDTPVTSLYCFFCKSDTRYDLTGQALTKEKEPQQ